MEPRTRRPSLLLVAVLPLQLLLALLRLRVPRLLLALLRLRSLRNRNWLHSDEKDGIPRPSFFVPDGDVAQGCSGYFAMIS